MFLNGDLIEIFVQQPQGFVVPGRESQVCQLHKALYGLRQAPRAWHTKFDACLKILVFSNLLLIHIYLFHERSTNVMLLVYVDDVYLAGNHSPKLNWIWPQLLSQFKMTNIGCLFFLLGVKFVQHPTGIFLMQRGYIHQILEDFSMLICNPACVPMLLALKLH